MITIKCARCKRKIFKYKKIGKGKLWHCWRERIIEDYSIKDGDKIKCECGNIIGIVQRRWIKLRQNSFIYSGAIENR
jgi:hypothetical protein